MKGKFRVIGCLMCILLLVVGGFPVTAEAEESGIFNAEVEVTFGQTQAREMLAMINEFRTGGDAWAWDASDKEKVRYDGLGKLQYDYELERIAMQRAVEVALSFSHTRPNGESCFTAYGDAFRAKGENIAAGYATATAVFIGWQETDEPYSGQGHRRNMLNPDFNAVGIGHVYYNGYHYWTQEFGYVSEPDMASVAADDTEKTVSVEIHSSMLSNMAMKCDKKEMELKVEESVPLPKVHLEANISGHWPGSESCKLVSCAASGEEKLPVVWASSDSKLVSVTADGELKAVAKGKTSVTAKQGAVSVTVPVTVTDPADEDKKTDSPEAGGEEKTDISKAKLTLSKTSYVYDGKTKKPTVTVKIGSKKLIKNTDYTVSYKSNTNVGTASVIVTGKGAYEGKITKTFKINPKGTLISGEIIAGSKRFTVSWEEQKTATTGYQVQYSTTENFETGTNTLKTVKDNTVTKLVVSKLESGHTYYVRVRTYTLVDEKKYYSAWSEKKSVKVR